MAQTPQPRPSASTAKTKQLKAAADSLPKTGKASGQSTQKCAAAKPKSDWQCVTYGKKKLRGPKYHNKNNRQPMSGYQHWHTLINSGKITEQDAKVMLLMSPNEGDFNSVQAYDNQALTAGAMQKTVNSSGQGELPDQINRFKKNHPDKYKSLVEDKGWSVDQVDVKNKKGKIVGKKNELKYSYTDKDGKVVTVPGNKLYSFIKSYCSAGTDADTKANVEKALNSMRQATEDDDYKQQQILDFKTRLDDAISQTPTGYDYPISDYMHSAKGRALALDQSVNRPAYVEDDYGEALDEFYKNNPKVSKNPADWGDNRSTYEDQINAIYGPDRRGTDMDNRYKQIRDAPNPVIPADVPSAPASGPVTPHPAQPAVTPPSSRPHF